MSELPHGLDWRDAPTWATVLLDGGAQRPSKYSWDASHKDDAARQYAEGVKLDARVEKEHLYKLVAVRPAH